ncbi:MAG TPA: M3 family metallopeptidase [Opitutaceae bacterium]|nr:M3 family metallopeptidase [Opitutaceae bacterium]
MKVLLRVVCVAALPAAVFAAPLPTLESVQATAAKYHAEIRVPAFETTPDQIAASQKAAIAMGDAALDRIARQDPAKATFASTFVALDNATADVALVTSRIDFVNNTNPSPAMRAAAATAEKALNQWAVGVQYREDVYRAIKAFAATNPSLTGEDKRLFDYTLRDYRRAGLDLPPAKRAEVEALRKELTAGETDFLSNINNTKVPMTFTKAELAGVSDDFLSSVKSGDDAYTILVNVTPQRMKVEENCSVADTRKKVTIAEYNLAKAVNLPLLNRLVTLRNQIALKLGYASWDDYQTEVKMAKNGATATKFIEDLVRGIQPKFDAEMAELQKLKAAETHDPNAKIELWDWRYYQNQLIKQRYTIDTDALRVYFPYQRTLEGMFAIYQSLFGLKFQQIQAPYTWADGVTLWEVSDAKSGEPMGLFYLDMFPRDGKFNHFAEFGVQPGWIQPNGVFLRPTVALLCNFTPATKDKPSLLDHEEVQTMFHEFGHCMHAILTQAHYARFSGTNVPGDFVEAPSQMLENWTFDKSVLDTFAADYRDPSKKVPAAILDRMKQVRLATIGVFYRRQFAIGLMDLALHGPHAPGEVIDAQAIANPIISRVFLPVPADSAWPAYIGHMAEGYDAGYYGYAWADSIAADMASVFEKSPHGYLDRDTGMRLRREIYSRGDSRPVSVSIEKFLGRKESDAAFLKKLGIE